MASMHAGTRWVVWAMCLSVGCAAEIGPVVDVHGEDPDPELGRSAEGLSLRGLGRGCSTSGTEGLSRQLLQEMQCISNDSLIPVSHPNIVRAHSRVHLYLSRSGRDALLSVARAGHVVRVNSALRTLAEQYVLWRGCPVAAYPGFSNHETGLALDVENYGAVGQRLQRAGFARPLPYSDPVHYEARGPDHRDVSVRAFQRLWNRNHPGDRIAEDGDPGPATLDRLSRSPAQGFPRGASCGAGTPSEPPSGDGSCRHTFGGQFADGTCTGTLQCCSGAWTTRGSCGACGCTDVTGEEGCAEGGDTPAPSDGESCDHSFGGRYGHRACSRSYQCCDGSWFGRGSCGSCSCEEFSGDSGCGT